MRRILRIISPSCFFILFALPAMAQGDRVTQRMFLVGDAGELENGKHPVCDWLKQHVDWNDSSNVLIYLGDNIYPKGMPAEGSAGRDAAQQVLDYQVSVVQGKAARAFFVPGNHDWKEGKPGGWGQVKNEEAYLESLGLSNVGLLPKGGCAGPVAVEIGEKMVLVCMDSQWWLQQDDRPGLNSDCDCKDEKSIVNGLRDIVSTYPDKLIVLAMHHPMYSHGMHGGYYTLKQHIFPLTDVDRGLYIPLPIIGSIYPLARGVFGNVQDIPNPKYKELREQVESVIQGHSNVIHVAGHDHTLQLLKEDSVYYVVSGAGSKSARVKMGDGSLFSREGLGFAVIEMYASGRSAIKFYSPEAKGLDESLFTAAVPALKPRVDTQLVVASFPDSVMAVGDSSFYPAGGFKRLMLGSNYRKEWSIPVRVKVFDMTGWTPLQRGGGNQTRSLRIKDPQGVEYVLRGVKKYVTDGALPTALVGDVFVKDLVTDGVSASYPYAALSIPPMAEALGVPHASPVLVYMPDDPRLGKFRADYGNLFALLEQREPGNGKKTYNFEDLDKKLFEDNDNKVDQKATLTARLLDMFVMDFDRHEDQWRWMADDNGKGKTFTPVPRDRDQPFFINEGVLPWILGSAWATPQVQGFRVRARNIDSYNFNARNFDHNHLSGLSEQDWREGVARVLAVMTDSMIEACLHLQPAVIHSYAMQSVIDKLKERRKYFLGEMMDYYRFLARTVSVYGSDKREFFDVERKADGNVTITVFKINKDGEKSKVLYQRTFIKGETREVRLYGLGGDDVFQTRGEGGDMLVRMIGGPGNDNFVMNAKAPAVKTKIYDLRSEKNTVSGDGGHITFLSTDAAVNGINRLGFKYDVLAPLVTLGYNPDDGVFVGAGFRLTTQGFHKDPYKQLHNLMVEHSLSTRAYAFKYDFEAIHAIGSLDLLANVLVKAPNNTINFFGLGNESYYNKYEKDGVRYYRARFNEYEGDLLLRKRLGSVFSVAAGPVYQYFTVDSADNKDRYINQPGVPGVEHSNLYDSRGYAGGRVTVIVDNRNDKVMPSRGIYWHNQYSALGGLNNESNAYSQLNSDLSLYTSFNTRANFVIATRVGWGKTFGNYQFYQAQFLGATENLRGFRKYRFSGDEALYNNVDLRIKLADFQTYLFPGSLGIQLFNDVGRVWVDGEKSDQWHDGYGGGFWISPLKKLVLTASYATSHEGGEALIKLGWQY